MEVHEALPLHENYSNLLWCNRICQARQICNHGSFQTLHLMLPGDAFVSAGYKGCARFLYPATDVHLFYGTLLHADFDRGFLKT